MMLLHSKRFRLFGVLASCWLLGSQIGQAADYFFTLGGGYSPRGNQISIERNILYFQRFLKSECPNAARHDLFFSDGAIPTADLQFADPSSVPEANRLMAQFLGRTRYLDLQYRNHEVPKVRGMTSNANIDRWFAVVGKKTKPGDRVILYATAHGGLGKNKKKSNETKLYLWNNQSISVKDLSQKLEKLPKGVDVVLVMVQCHSGGFANVIFNQADKKAGATTRNICGFFSTIYSRPAAGCTPDIDEENYEEYSTYFWAGLSGTTRTGKKIPKPDFDRDDKVSFEEAHAHVLLTSNSIDIPIKTSGVFLRAYSVLKQPKDWKPKTKTAKVTLANQSPQQPTNTEPEKQPAFVTPESPFSKLLALSSPADVAILFGLSEELNLENEERYTEAKKKAAALKKERGVLNASLSRSSKQHSILRKKIASRMKTKWPELSNTLSPKSIDLLTKDSEEFVALVKKMPGYDAFEELGNEIENATKEKLDLERRWAKCMRLTRTLENIALANNLPLIAEEKVISKYKQLIELEQSGF